MTRKDNCFVTFELSNVLKEVAQMLMNAFNLGLNELGKYEIFKTLGLSNFLKDYKKHGLFFPVTTMCAIFYFDSSKSS